MGLLTTLRTRMKTWQRAGRFPLLVRVSSAVFRFAKNVPALVLLPWLYVQLRRSRSVSPAELVDLVFDGFGRVFRPIQNRAEIRRLVERLARERPRTLLEIGTACGGTLFLLCRAAAPDQSVLTHYKAGIPGIQGWFDGSGERCVTSAHPQHLTISQ